MSGLWAWSLVLRLNTDVEQVSVDGMPIISSLTPWSHLWCVTFHLHCGIVVFGVLDLLSCSAHSSQRTVCEVNVLSTWERLQFRIALLTFSLKVCFGLSAST